MEAFFRITKQLRNRKDIIIKPSDKNLGFTVMKRAWYIAEALCDRQQENPSTYQKLPGNQT